MVQHSTASNGTLSETFFGFLDLNETSNQEGYIGSVLVLNQEGVPQEFRCTHPVKPTAVQRSLYGNTLEPHIGINLCALPLLKTLRNVPSVLFVRKEFLLNMRAAKQCTIPVVFIRRVVGNAKASLEADTNLRVYQLDEFSFSAHPNFQNDTAEANRGIKTSSFSTDLLEPFDRTVRALSTLAKQDTTFA